MTDTCIQCMHDKIPLKPNTDDNAKRRGRNEKYCCIFSNQGGTKDGVYFCTFATAYTVRSVHLTTENVSFLNGGAF